MREICLVTENGITRQAEDSSEFKKKSAEWYVHYDDYELLKKEIKELEARLAIATEALEFYAHVDHWNHINPQTALYTVIGSDDIGDGSFQFNEDIDDDNVGGKKARQALAEIKGVKK